MKWAKLIGLSLLAGAAVLALPEMVGPGPRADFQVGDKLAAGALLVPLALIFLGGLLTAATPCVYPLIPITVAVFGARKASSRGRAVALTLVYVLGIAAMFTSLGIFAALGGRAFGSVLGNPYVVAGLAAFFTAMAASMFGAFDLQLPVSLQTRLGSMGKAGFAGAFLMGLVAGLVAAPCTGPVLSGVLVHVATTQDVAQGASLLFSYSLGLGLPFFLIGAFSLSLPKSGAWMEKVKSLFGVALLALALAYLRDAFPAVRAALHLGEVSFGAVLAAGLVVAGLLLGAIHRTFRDWPVGGALKAVGVAVAVIGLSMRPGAPLAAPAPIPDIAWAASEPEALARASRDKKPTIIDFFAEWCAACKELARHTFKDPDFLRAASRFELIKIDGTEETDEVERLYLKYKVDGLPTVVFIDSGGRVLERLTVKGFVPASDFVRMMQTVE